MKPANCSLRSTAGSPRALILLTCKRRRRCLTGSREGNPWHRKTAFVEGTYAAETLQSARPARVAARRTRGRREARWLVIASTVLSDERYRRGDGPSLPIHTSSGLTARQSRLTWQQSSYSPRS